MFVHFSINIPPPTNPPPSPSCGLPPQPRPLTERAQQRVSRATLVTGGGGWRGGPRQKRERERDCEQQTERERDSERERVILRAALGDEGRTKAANDQEEVRVAPVLSLRIHLSRFSPGSQSNWSSGERHRLIETGAPLGWNQPGSLVSLAAMLAARCWPSSEPGRG